MILNTQELIKNNIKTIENYPKKGVLFYDVTSLLEKNNIFSSCVKELLTPFKNIKIDKIAGTEARGFLFGAALAFHLNAGFIPIRKANKLPRETLKQNYTLEYGQDTLEIHKDALKENENVLLIDDLLATGGTILASIDLLKGLKANLVGASFVICLKEFKAKNKLDELGIKSHFLAEF